MEKEKKERKLGRERKREKAEDKVKEGIDEAHTIAPKQLYICVSLYRCVLFLFLPV